MRACLARCVGNRFTHPVIVQGRALRFFARRIFPSPAVSESHVTVRATQERGKGESLTAVRTFYVRRKDLEHVPFQFYVSGAGVETPLDEGFMSVFALMPPKRDFDVVYVHVLSDFMRESEARWDIRAAEHLRIAAKALEAWLKDEPIPADHFYGPDMLRVDRDWYPHESDQSPSLALNPYSFEVVTDEPWPQIDEWFLKTPVQPESPPSDSVAIESHTQPSTQIVFGYTSDVCPASLFVGYNQFKHKVTGAGLDVVVSLTPLNALPARVDVLFVPQELVELARQSAPNTRIEALDNFLNQPIYNILIKELGNGHALTLDAEGQP